MRERWTIYSLWDCTFFSCFPVFLLFLFEELTLFCLANENVFVCGQKKKKPNSFLAMVWKCRIVCTCVSQFHHQIQTNVVKELADFNLTIDNNDIWKTKIVSTVQQSRLTPLKSTQFPHLDYFFADVEDAAICVKWQQAHQGTRGAQKIAGRHLHPTFLFYFLKATHEGEIAHRSSLWSLTWSVIPLTFEST